MSAWLTGLFWWSLVLSFRVLMIHRQESLTLLGVPRYRLRRSLLWLLPTDAPRVLRNLEPPQTLSSGPAVVECVAVLRRDRTNRPRGG